MKKIALICILAIVVAVLCSCGNMSMGIGNYNFKKIHLDTHNHARCLTVEKWYESEGGIEVYTTEVGAIFCSEGTYILLEDRCPFCD